MANEDERVQTKNYRKPRKIEVLKYDGEC